MLLLLLLFVIIMIGIIILIIIGSVISKKQKKHQRSDIYMCVCLNAFYVMCLFFLYILRGDIQLISLDNLPVCMRRSCTVSISLCTYTYTHTHTPHIALCTHAFHYYAFPPKSLLFALL